MLKCSSWNKRFTNKQALKTHLYQESPECRSPKKKAAAPVPSAPTQSLTRAGRGSQPAPGTVTLPTRPPPGVADVTGLESVFSAWNVAGGDIGTHRYLKTTSFEGKEVF